MKAFKTLLFAAVAMLAIGAASCDKGKKSEEQPKPNSTNVLDSVMDVASKGVVAELNCDTVLTTDTKVENATVVYFYAQNAPSCAPLNEPMSKLASDNEGKVAVIAVDVASCPKTAANFGLDEETPLVPHVVILFPDGGSQAYPEIGDFIAPELKDKTAEEQAEGIYANLLKYTGLTESND